MVELGLTHEDELINGFNNKFVSNRIRGDEFPAGIDGAKPKRISN